MFNKQNLDLERIDLGLCHEYKILPLRTNPDSATFYCENIPDESLLDNLKWVCSVKHVAFEVLKGNDVAIFRATLDELTTSILPPLHRDTYHACPRCASQDVKAIVFGFPDDSLLEAAERGDVVLGGCDITSANPDYRCISCKYEWRVT